MIYTWAKRHDISNIAIAELMQLLGVEASNVTERSELSESAVQTNIRLEASRKGIRLWRNNVGVAHNPEEGTYVRYGLANESSQMNKVVKSGDLIGVRPVTITPAHVGTVIGQFVSREAKHGAWRYTGTEREVAQLNWINLVNSLGGDATFASGEGTL
jgi:hypothetical protein